MCYVHYFSCLCDHIRHFGINCKELRFNHRCMGGRYTSRQGVKSMGCGLGVNTDLGLFDIYKTCGE